MYRNILYPVIAILMLIGCKSPYAELGDGLFADIQTSMGDVVVKLEYQKAPVTVASFVSLAEGNNPYVTDSLKGKKYFDGLIFHRVMKDFVIQGGDPQASGMGGPGYKFKDEFNDSLKHDAKGKLSMANPGSPNTNGSQFFITLNETPWLDGRHSVFGEVVRGMDVVDSIGSVATSKEPATKDRPIEDVTMNKVIIVRNGKDAKAFDAVSVMNDYFAKVEAREQASEKAKLDIMAEFQDQMAKAKAHSSGLKVLYLEKGKGDKPKVGQKVLVNYAGYLMDGTLIDTSWPEVAEKYGKTMELEQMHRGKLEPSTMDYSMDSPLIAGFKEGMMEMRAGDKVRLFIPPHLGWGQQGGGPIPPNADVVFDVQLLGLAKEQE